MKKNLAVTTIAAAIALSGCMNDGDDFADRSRAFAKCQLNKSETCSVTLPAGAKFERATVASQEDAVRITSTLRDKADCESYVDRAYATPGVMIQVIVNDIVVRPYNGPPVPDAIRLACATSPYTMKMIVATVL